MLTTPHPPPSPSYRQPFLYGISYPNFNEKILIPLIPPSPRPSMIFQKSQPSKNKGERLHYIKCLKNKIRKNRKIKLRNTPDAFTTNSSKL